MPIRGTTFDWFGKLLVAMALSRTRLYVFAACLVFLLVAVWRLHRLEWDTDSARARWNDPSLDTWSAQRDADVWGESFYGVRLAATDPGAPAPIPLPTPTPAHTKVVDASVAAGAPPPAQGGAAPGPATSPKTAHDVTVPTPAKSEPQRLRRALGVEAQGGEMIVVIPENAPLPAKGFRLVTPIADKQSSVAAGIFEGESGGVLTERAIFLGEVFLDELPHHFPTLKLEFEVVRAEEVTVTLTEVLPPPQPASSPAPAVKPVSSAPPSAVAPAAAGQRSPAPAPSRAPRSASVTLSLAMRADMEEHFGEEEWDEGWDDHPAIWRTAARENLEGQIDHVRQVLASHEGGHPLAAEEIATLTKVLTETETWLGTHRVDGTPEDFEQYSRKLEEVADPITRRLNQPAGQ